MSVLKCLMCNNEFYEGEQSVKMDRHGFRFGPAEEYCACPACGGTDLEEMTQCVRCGAWSVEADMHGTICDDCVTECIGYDSFLEFATTGAKYSDEIDTLEDFIFRSVFDVTPTTLQSSYEMKQAFRDIYTARVENDALMGQTEFLDLIKTYMNNWSVRDDFAEWLEQREAKYVR